MKECMFRENLTSFIRKSLKSRQEEIPLVGKYIGQAYCEPLHLKKNVVKEMFLKVINITLKLVSAIFYQSFIFHQMIALQKL